MPRVPRGARLTLLWVLVPLPPHVCRRCRYAAVTSFNEWHEGTQIEPAKPFAGFPSYAPEGPNFYLEQTLQHAKRWEAVVYG